MASCIITANWLESDLAVILVMSFAFFGQGMVGLGWTLISDIAPKGLGGLTGGLFNFCANLAGILTPLVIGFIVAGFGNFFYALIYIGAPRCWAWWPICLSSATSNVSSYRSKQRSKAW